MNNRLALPSFLCLSPLLVGLGTSAAQAQVSTNLEALPAAPAHTGHARTGHTQNGHAGGPGHQKAVYAPPLRHTPVAPAPLPAPTAAPTPAGYTRVPRVPPNAPKPVTIKPPVFPVVIHPPVPAAKVTANADSHSHVESPLTDTLRILFDNNSTEMNEATITAVQHYAQSMAPHAETRLILRSYAALPGSDISMPRRIALSRALSIRSLLVQGGVATTRIYPIAQGRPDNTDTAPADRLDIAVETNPPPVASSPSIEKGAKAP